MSSQAYKEQIVPLKDKLVNITDNFFNTSEAEVNNILHELTQEINESKHDTGLLDIVPETMDQSEHEDNSNMFIDYECIPSKMNEFNQLLNSLVVLYLEQESLDHFLRFTITTNKYLKIESIKDPEYRNLENQLKILKEDQIDEKQLQLNQIKQDILNKSKNIAKLENDIKKVGLAVTNDIDECMELLKELESLQELEYNKEVAQNDKDQEELELENLSQIKTEHDNIQKLTQRRNYLERKIKSIPIKNYINSDDKKDTGTIQEQQADEETVKKLITVYESPILNKFNDIDSFKIDYNNKQVKFSVDRYENTIYLTKDNKFDKIEICDKQLQNERDIGFEDELKDKYYKYENIFNIIHVVKRKQLKQ